MKKILTLSKFKTYKFQTVEDLCSYLNVDVIGFKNLVRFSETEYTPLFKLKKNGVDYRTIHAPSEELKKVQYAIYDKVLQSLILPTCVYGHSQSKSIIENAAFHSSNNYLLNVDIIDFFPSIRYVHIKKLFKELTDSEELSSQLTKLLTYKGVLPQGSPASPYLSAIILNNLDSRLINFCKIKGFRYTRYFDDISISGGKSLFNYENIIFKIIECEGFKIHKTGEKISRFIKGDTKTVTGIQILPDGSLCVSNHSQLEIYVESLKMNGIGVRVHQNLLKEKQILQGRIAFLASVMPELGEKLKKSFDAIVWRI